MQDVEEGSTPGEKVQDGSGPVAAGSITGTTNAMADKACQDPLEAERAKSQEYEEKYKRALADYVNLERRTAADIQNGINRAMDGMVREFLDIYDDFARARDAYRAEGAGTAGLDSILKNADAMLRKHGVTPIESLGRIFDPRLHEAMSTKSNPALEEQTVTQELRKGYIAQDRVIRPALVEISTKGVTE